MKRSRWTLSAMTAAILLCWTAAGGAASPQPDLWDLARREIKTHRFSTLLTAQDVRDRLASEEGIKTAIAWCQRTAVTKAYVECFRDGFQARRETLTNAIARLRAAGIEASGCVTTTGIGKRSSGWSTVSCYTDKATQERIKEIFEFAASLSDEIMIDDFWFTDCRCAECDQARRSKTVTVGGKSHPVGGDGWEAYHCELMVTLSQDYVLAAAKRVNPKARLIIKYPQWYDNFHERGYEVARQTRDFDWIWVGTETRDYRDQRWGGTVQYEAFFIMRWLGGIGGTKCGGGWFDWLGTTERTYVEQARQTVLGGARESMLFCYGGLQGSTGPKDIEALRTNIPELFQVASEVGRRELTGIAAYKPIGSHPENEQRVFDFVGMLGLPLAPCHEFPTNAPAAFFSIHALKDPEFAAELAAFVASGKPVLVTDGLAGRVGEKLQLKSHPNVQILPVKGNPKTLLEWPQERLDALRGALLRPLQTSFKSPNRVAFYLFKDGSWVVENFNDAPATVEVRGESVKVDARGWLCRWEPKQ